MHKLLEVPRRNFARARLTISLARTSPTKGVILVSYVCDVCSPSQSEIRIYDPDYQATGKYPRFRPRGSYLLSKGRPGDPGALGVCSEEGHRSRLREVNPPKKDNSSDLAHYFAVCGAVVIIYSLLFFRRQGGHSPCAPLGTSLLAVELEHHPVLNPRRHRGGG